MRSGPRSGLASNDCSRRSKLCRWRHPPIRLQESWRSSTAFSNVSRAMTLRSWHSAAPGFRLELDRILPRQLLNGDPTQLGELLERCAPAEAAEPAFFDAAERHLRL